MMKKWIALCLAFVMAFSLAACGAEEETTLAGMVVSVDGTKISLMEMDTSNMGNRDVAKGERPQMPEGMEGFGGFENFNPENFNPENFEGAMPEGGNFPQWENGEKPEGMEFPEGMTMPEGMEFPEGMPAPENGQMPNFNGENGSARPGMGNWGEGMETKQVDIGSAHISVEIENGKESGSMANIVPGAFVTITMNGKGEVTYVLVSSQTGFGGGRRPTN